MFIFGLDRCTSHVWNIDWNVWKCSACQERTPCPVSKWPPGGAWIFFFFQIQNSLFHQCAECTEPRPILNSIIDPEILVNYILNGRLFHSRNRKFPISSPRQYSLSLRTPKEKSVYLFKDCLVRMESEEGLLQPDPGRLGEIC